MTQARLAFVAVNPEGGSLAGAMLHAVVVGDTDLAPRVEVHQYGLDLDTLRHPHYDMMGVVTGIVEENPDFVGLSCWCWNYDLMVEIAALFARLRPNVPLVVGGGEIHAEASHLIEAFPEGTWVVQGEGERPLCALLARWLDGENDDRLPAGVGRLTGGRVLWSDEASRPLEGYEIPSPYLLDTLRLGDTKWMPGYASYRGCTFACSYCQWGDGRGTRAIPIDRVLRELEILGNMGFEHVWIVDTIFGRDWDRDSRIVDALAAWPQDVHVSFELHPSFVSERLVESLARLNLRWVALGVQTFTPKALLASGRGRSPKPIWRAVGLLYKGLPEPHRIHIDLIFGLPEDSVEAVLSAMDAFKDRYPLATFYCSLLQVLPGTPLWRKAVRENWVCATPRQGHELVSRRGMGVAQTRRVKRIVLGVDFLQHSEARMWQVALLERRPALCYSALAEIAGQVCEAHAIAWHSKDDREFFFDSLHKRDPTLFSRIKSDIEAALNAHVAPGPTVAREMARAT